MRKSSVVSQHTNADEWVSLGYYSMGSNAQVSLSNITTDADDGMHDVAFDSIAFVPIAGTTVTHTFDAVSIFSPDQDLDTNAPSQFNTPMHTMQTLYDWMNDRIVGGPDWNGSNTNITGLLQCPTCASIGAETSSCIGPDLYTSTSEWGQQMADAGAVPTGNQMGGGMTMAKLMGMANPTPNPSQTHSQAFASNLSYKIKTHISITWLDQNGQIVPGSQHLAVNFGTGDTAMPQFVINFMNAVQTDYGVAVPNLSFSETDGNQYTMESKTVPNPLSVGSVPALAYIPHYTAPVLDTTSDCLALKTVTGGADGFRPLDTQAGTTDANVSAWVANVRTLQSQGKLPQQVADTANDIYNLFFRAWGAGGWGNAAMYNYTPPIWQEIGIEFCDNGTVKPYMSVPDGDDTPQNGLVYQSYMPDLYLYLDNKMVDETGAPTTSPVQSGNFGLFSNVPLFGGSDQNNPFDFCDTSQRGNGGNPWNIVVPVPSVPQNVLPSNVMTCDDRQLYTENSP